MQADAMTAPPKHGTTATVTRPIQNLSDVEFTRNLEHGERFSARMAPVSENIGAEKLAYNVTEVPPGKRAFPFHNHHNNEEMFLILEGSGTLRFGEEEYKIGPHDVVACPPGGAEKAHQIINTGDGPLRYLAISTTLGTDVFQYPDSGKFGVAAGRKPGTGPQDATFKGFYDEESRLDYWKGE